MSNQGSGLLQMTSKSSSTYEAISDVQDDDSSLMSCTPNVSLPNSAPKSLLHRSSDGSFGVSPASSHFTTGTVTTSSPGPSRRQTMSPVSSPTRRSQLLGFDEHAPTKSPYLNITIGGSGAGGADSDFSAETKSDSWTGFLDVLTLIPGFVIGCVLNLMLCVPFGLALFPPSWEPLPFPRTVGVQMFLLSTGIAQVVFSLTSGFQSSVGMMMVENIPFMHSLAFIVAEEQGFGPDAMATLFVCFALSSIVVGVMFFLLGYLKLGAFIYFIPRHVIIGCIGGVGVFVTKTGFEVSTGIPWDGTSSTALQYTTFKVARLWVAAVVAVMILRVSQRLGMRRYSLFPPAYFIAIAPFFYFVIYLFPAFGFPDVDLDAARQHGWFFPIEEAAPFSIVFQVFDFSSVRWDVVLKGIPTILALTAFSLMHVPINVPSLSSSTSDDSIDMNHELVVHGYSNFLSGVFGGTQNYLCYSNSLLYWKCKGRGRGAGVCLAAATFYFFVQGPGAVQYVPRCMAGCLLIHLGLELVKEALLDSFYLFDVFEYTSVLIITITMTFMGMTVGLGVGVLLAVLTFTLQIGKSSQPIRRARRATTLRSSRYRPADYQTELLNTALRNVLILQLQGTLFFGNATILTSEIGHHIRSGEEQLRSVILDFTLVHYIDTSACDTIASTLSLAKKHGVNLVFVRGSPNGFACEKNKGFLTDSIKLGASCGGCAVVDTLDDALFAIEEEVLKETTTVANTSISSSLDSGGEAKTSEELFADLFLDDDKAAVLRLFSFFTKIDKPEGHVLWRVGQTSSELAFIATGTVLSILDESDNQATELVHPGNIIGDYAFLVNGTQTTTVECKEQCCIFILDKAGLARILREEPFLAFVLSRLTISYLGHRTAHVSNRIWEAHCVPI